jgi:tetratricopeptide (TPR) repeat protein
VIEQNIGETLEHRAEAPDVIFWLPGQEEEEHIAKIVCRLWPGTELHTIVDRVGSSRVFAASPNATWTPAVVPGRDRKSLCGSELETEAKRAAEALQHATTLQQSGRRDEAIASLRNAAGRLFLQVRLFETLADLLLSSAPSRDAKAEAVYWAQRAALASEGEDAQALRTFGRALAAQGRAPEALDAARRARQAAVAAGKASLAAQIDADIERYEAMRRSPAESELAPI